MNICRKCKHADIDFGVYYGCDKEYGFDPVTGIKYIIGNCEIKNAFGDCPDYEEKISIWKRFAKWIKNTN